MQLSNWPLCLRALVRKVKDKTLLALLRQLRVETNKEKFAVRYLRVEDMANAGHKEAQHFIRVYGHRGTHSSPAEWSRAYVIDFPTSSVSLERHHREIKRVRNVKLYNPVS